MKSKTARRFLNRNKTRMIKHESGIDKQPSSFVKRWKQATKDAK